jgi:ribosomal protein S18 acetylase RimI-like enzyme
MTNIRTFRADDLAAVKDVIASTELFPPELMDGMTASFLAGAEPGELWLIVDAPAPVAIAYVARERMTSGTANLLLIAVHASRHGSGIGGTLLREVERLLTERGDRILLVETSALPEFARTRGFYLAHGYEEEARIRDFYEAGHDKIVFRKPLPAA